MVAALLKNKVALAWTFLGIASITFILSSATTHYRYSDPFYVTEVADRLVNEFRVDLENFEDLGRIHPGQRVSIINGIPYHYYPIGVVLSHVPSVLVANAMGVVPYKNDIELQKYNSIVLLSLSWLVFALTALRTFKSAHIGPLCFLMFITSPIIGSLGSAHWNTTPALLLYFIILSFIFEMMQTGTLSKRKLALLGFILGTALVVRPTCLAAIVPVLVLFYQFNKKALFRIVTTTFISLGFWLITTKFLYESYFPSYFSAHDAVEQFQPLQALSGILLSPSRGFFVFAPLYLFIGFIFIFLFKKMSDIKDRWLCSVLLLWITVHWAGVVLLAPHWEGGWCFGPRLLVETLPMWFFMTLILQKHLRLKQNIMLRWLILACLIWGAFLNIIQSQYNPYTSYWNESISQKHFPQVLWDWEYPPWLNNAQRHNERLDKYGITHF